MNTVKLEYETNEELCKKLTAILETKGFTVIAPEAKWFTPKQVAEQFSLSPKTLSDRLKTVYGFPVRRGKSGRILKLQLTKQLSEYLSNRPQKTIRLIEKNLIKHTATRSAVSRI